MTDAERIGELKAALEPFATYYRRIDSPQFRSDAAIVIEVPGDLALTVGAFRQAARAMWPARSAGEVQASQLLDIVNRPEPSAAGTTTEPTEDESATIK